MQYGRPNIRLAAVTRALSKKTVEHQVQYFSVSVVEQAKEFGSRLLADYIQQRKSFTDHRQIHLLRRGVLDRAETEITAKEVEIERNPRHSLSLEDELLSMDIGKEMFTQHLLTLACEAKARNKEARLEAEATAKAAELASQIHGPPTFEDFVNGLLLDASEESKQYDFSVGISAQDTVPTGDFEGLRERSRAKRLTADAPAKPTWPKDLIPIRNAILAEARQAESQD